MADYHICMSSGVHFIIKKNTIVRLQYNFQQKIGSLREKKTRDQFNPRVPLCPSNPTQPVSPTPIAGRKCVCGSWCGCSLLNHARKRKQEPSGPDIRNPSRRPHLPWSLVGPTLLFYGVLVGVEPVEGGTVDLQK